MKSYKNETEDKNLIGKKVYTSFSNPPTIEWTQIWGGIDNDYARALAFDSSENIYIVGDSRPTPTGFGDLVLMKFDIYGYQVWNRTWGGNFQDSGYAIIIDNANNIFVTGSTNFGSDDYDFLLIKYNTAGDEIWNRTWGGVDKDIASAIALDSNNNIYLAGFTGSFGAGAADFCLVKFNSSGDYQWNRTWGSSGNEMVRDIALDSLGNIYLAGYSTQNFINKIKIVKYDNSGEFLWNQSIDAGVENYVSDIVIDSSNNIFLTGFIEESSQLPDLLLVKLNSSGETQWYRTWGGSSRDIGFAIRFDDYGDIMVVGNTNNNDAAKTDAIMVKFNQLGENKWNFSWGNYFNDYFYDLILDSDNDIYVVGFSDVLGEAANFLLMKINNPPTIFINEPSSFQQFGNNTFFYNISVFDANLDTMWYSLDNGTTNFTISSTTGFVNQAAWDSCENGTVSVRFYANDTSSNLSFEDIKVLKDKEPPEIIINSPNSSQIIGNVAPDFNVSITDGNLNSTWYNLNNTLNHSFSGMFGKINQSSWDTFDSGTIEIKFSANDTLGNSAFRKVEVVKDNIPPFFDILSPFPAQIFGNSSPHFQLNIIESNINKSWYLLNETSEDYFTGNNGIINQTLWDAFGDGDIKIKFYINDLAGNIESQEITVRKDISAPSIIINSPKPLQLFGNNTPFFNVTISDSKINSTWYSLDGGITNYTYSGTTGYINQSVWDFYGNGTITVQFYANDTMGITVYVEIIILKDMINPVITIFYPSILDFFGSLSPHFQLSIYEGNLHQIWYTLNNENQKYFCNPNDQVDQSLWESLNDGQVNITFFANDTLGNTGDSGITIYKDTTDPISSLFFTAHSGIGEVNQSTPFTITATDEFGSGISLIRYKVNDSSWIPYTSSFDLSAYEPGFYLITYQAIDNIGNIETENMILIQLVEIPSDQPSNQPSILGYDTFLIIGVISVVAAILISKQKKEITFYN